MIRCVVLTDSVRVVVVSSYTLINSKRQAI